MGPVGLEGRARVKHGFCLEKKLNHNHNTWETMVMEQLPPVFKETEAPDISEQSQ